MAALRAGVEEAVPAEEEGEDGARAWWSPHRMYSASFVFSLIHFLFGKRGLAALWGVHDFKLDFLF